MGPSLSENEGVAGATVLVVDDDDMICEIVAGMLEILGYTVVTLTDSEQALAQVSSIKPALLILDMAMPKLSGSQVVDLLRAEGFDVPVLLSSGYVKTDEINSVCANPNVGYLKKPFTISELSEAVAQMLIREG